jgi:hypothetical protein
VVHRSADEVRAEFVQSFPTGTGELADELSSSNNMQSTGGAQNAYRAVVVGLNGL